MFFHCIIFAKQGQSHRPTGRGAGSRAAPRKSLIPLSDSVVRTLGRGPWTTVRARRRAVGSGRPGRRSGHRWRASRPAAADLGADPGIDGGHRWRASRPAAADLGTSMAGQPTGGGGRLYRARGQGPWIGPVRFTVQGAGGAGRDSLKIAEGPQT